MRAPLELARAQARRGYDVWVASVGEEAWVSEWHGVRLVTLRRSERARLRWRGRTIDFRPLLPFLRLTLRVRFDVLHAHHYYYQRFLPVPRKIVHVHQDPLGAGAHDEDGTPKQLHFSSVKRYSDACIAVSEYVADSLRRLMGDDAAIYAVPNGVARNAHGDLESEGRDLRRRLGVEDGDELLLYAGAFVPEKGVHVLADAFADLAARRTGTHLALAGGHALWSPGDATDDKHAKYLADLSRRLEMPATHGRVHHLGRLSPRQMAAAYAAADIVVVPSTCREGFNLVAAEAAVAARPVVATRSGGLVEVAASTGAILVPPDDALALADALSDLLEDPELRATLGRTGRTGSRAFDWDVAAERIEGIYFPTELEEELTNDPP